MPNVGSREAYAGPGPGRLTVMMVVLALTNLISMMDRTALAILMPPIQAEMMFNDRQMGALSGLAFAVFFAFAGLPIARLADRGDRRLIIAVCAAIWSLATAATGLAQGFWQMVLARIGVGAGEAGCVPPAHSIIASYFPVERRSSRIGFYSAAGPIGALIGLAAGGALAAAYGWRAAFVILGLPGLAVAVLVFLLVPEPPRPARPAAAPPSRLKADLAVLLGRRSFLLILCAVALGGLVFNGLIQWLPTFFVRAHDQSLGQVGLMFGLAYGLGSLFGMAAGGPLGDRLIARDRRWAAWLACLGFVVSCPAVIAALYLDAAPAYGLIFVASAAIMMSYGPVFAIVQSVAPSSQRALASALTLFASTLIGSGFGPLLIGELSDRFAVGTSAEGLRLAILGVVMVFPAPVGLYLWSTRMLASDLAEETSAPAD